MLKLVAVAASPSTRQTRRILVVDDEEDIREAVRDVIESSLDGTEVVTAASGGAALQVLREAPVDLIVTDYRMPGMTGVQLLDAAEGIVPGVRHILITAFDRELVSDLGPRAKAERIIQKPLEPERLVSEVERALGR